MYKLSATIAALIVLLSGCAADLAGTGASRAIPAEAWTSPVPEQPGYNRWHTPAPPD